MDISVKFLQFLELCLVFLEISMFLRGNRKLREVVNNRSASCAEKMSNVNLPISSDSTSLL